MALTVLDYRSFFRHENKVSSSSSITMSMNKIFATTSRWSKVRCESSPHWSESRPEPHPDQSRPWLEGLIRCSANYVPLSPISFLERAAEVYRDRTSIAYGSIKYTWKETHRRCLKLASALKHLGISRHDVVATLAPNVPALLELHFAVPMAGAIICPLNTRQDSIMLSNLLQHSEAKILFVDYQFLQMAKEALSLYKNTHTCTTPPLLVTISDNYMNSDQYETLVEGGRDDFSAIRPYHERDPISINYTSGTTSMPKGVVFSHRGAYLNSLASVLVHGMREMPTYLWTVPMFHCSGWCLCWGVAIVGGTNVCLRRCDPKDIFDIIALHKVTHMSGVPTVLNLIVHCPEAKPLPHKVEIVTGGAPPPPTILSKIEYLRFHVSHIYGLTETLGPGTWCLWKPEWDWLPFEEQSKLKARQGVKHFAMEEVDVKDPVTMESVKCDGESIGEIFLRGNTVMSGYLKDASATEEAFKGGWFRSGDLGVKHPDGYIEVKDRLKDIVISGGENISTIEVESVIYRFPGVVEVAVVARPDDHWGETPCAFVKMKEGADADEQDIIVHCRDHMPHYMAPRTVIFQDLPHNSAGKVQKFVLRDKAKALPTTNSTIFKSNVRNGES